LQEEYRNLLARVVKKIYELSLIIDDFALLGGMDDSQLVLAIKKVNLRLLIDKVLHDMKGQADEKEITVSFSCPHDIILDGDEKYLKRLFGNLLDNAIKYTFRKGRVELTARKDERFARIYVNDTGPGIPEDEIDYIFDRFYQVARSRSAKSGFGLGLSSAKAIVEAHKATIAVESQYGKGSTFIVTLPLSYPV